MTLWVCSGCSAAYAVGQPSCPQCNCPDHTEEGEMPKIRKEGLVSYATYADPEVQDHPTSTQAELDRGLFVQAQAAVTNAQEPEAKEPEESESKETILTNPPSAGGSTVPVPAKKAAAPSQVEKK